MEDYEIRDISRRASIPDLWIDFQFNEGKTAEINFPTDGTFSEPINLLASIENRSTEPALYAVINIYTDEKFILKSGGGSRPLGWTEIDKCKLNIHSINWSIPHKMPIFLRTKFSLFEKLFSFVIEKNSLVCSEFKIGFEIMAPGFSVKKMIPVILKNCSILQITESQ